MMLNAKKNLDMKRFAHILTPERVLYAVNLHSKKKVLELISETVENSIPALRAHDVFDGLIAREKLGSTAIGYGVAIPHTRLELANQAIGSFILLKDSVDFSAEDHIPVNILFSLIVPTEADEMHLTLLADIAQFLKQDINRKLLRQAKSHEALYKILCHA